MSSLLCADWAAFKTEVTAFPFPLPFPVGPTFPFDGLLEFDVDLLAPLQKLLVRLIRQKVLIFYHVVVNNVCSYLLHHLPVFDFMKHTKKTNFVGKFC